MSRERKVQYASPSSNRAGIINSGASTWGELLATTEIGRIYNGASGGLEAILVPGGHCLNREEAELPEGDIKIFLVPTKNKAGADSFKEALTAAIYEAVDIAIDEDSDMQSAIEEAVDDFFGFSGASSSTGTDSDSESARLLAESKRYL